MHSTQFSEIVNEPAFASRCVAACNTAAGAFAVLRLLALVPDLQPQILQPVQTLLEGHVARAATAELAQAIHFALDVPPLSTQAAERVDALDDDRFAKLIILGPRLAYVRSAIRRYVDSGTYDNANRRAELLVLPLAEHMTKEDALVIQRAETENSQVRNSTRFASVKERLTELGIWPPPVSQRAPN